jgi:hypothetical protein
MIRTDAEISAAVDAELHPGDARSAVYRQGIINVLRFRIQGVKIPCSYRLETVEADAYFSGNERGHVLWRKLREGRPRLTG